MVTVLPAANSAIGARSELRGIGTYAKTMMQFSDMHHRKVHRAIEKATRS